MTVSDTYYCPYTALYNSGGIVKELMLDCGDSWIASQICSLQDVQYGSQPRWGAVTVHGGPDTLFDGNGSNSYYNCNVRPIVVLNSNIKIDTSSTDGKSAENAFIIREK